jgi:hypothetical protein
MKNDTRSGGQRLADALVERCRCRAGGGHSNGAAGHPDGAGPRPQLIIKADLDTLAGIDRAPAGQLEWGAPSRRKRFAGSPATRR